MWPPGGSELFYTVGGGGMQLFARTIALDGLTFGREQLLPSPAFFQTGNGYRTYDVTPDGKRFLMILAQAEAASGPHINIVLNWFEELRQRVPAK